MDLRTLQEDCAVWRAYNFPGYTATQQLLGVVEEVGELSHSHLKAEQNIRESLDELQAMKIDACADIIIFLTGYCTASDIDLDDAVARTWAKVKQRDWVENPSGAGY